MERKERKTEKTGEVMIPRSVIVGAVRGAVTERTDDRIEQLADIIHGGMVWALERDARMEEQERRLDAQRADIVHAIDEMKAGFASMERRFEAVDKRFESVDKRFESMDKRFESMDKRFDSLVREMDARFEAVDRRFEAVDRRFEAVDKRFDDLIHHFDKRFSTLTWLIGTAFVVINVTVVLLRIF